MGSHFVDSHALDQPQSPRDGDAFVEALFQEDLARDAMGDRPTQSSKANCWVGQVVQPRFSSRISKRQTWGWLKGVRCSEATACLAFLKDSNEQSRQGRCAGFILEIRPERRPGRVHFILSMPFVGDASPDKRLGEHVFGMATGPQKQIRSFYAAISIFRVRRPVSDLLPPGRMAAQGRLS